MRAFITLEGAGADSTIVQWGDTADSPTGPKGRPLGTFNSATFAVNAQYFLARNITFKVTATVRCCACSVLCNLRACSC